MIWWLHVSGGSDKVTINLGGDSVRGILIAFASGGQIQPASFSGAFGLSNPDPCRISGLQNLPDARAFEPIVAGQAGNQMFWFF